MSDLKQLVFEYRSLLHRFEWSRAEMTDAGIARLRSLDRLFGEEPAAGRERRQHARCALGGTATVQMGRSLHQVRVIDLGGGGLCLSPPPPLRPGERAVVQLSSDDRQFVYQYAVEVAWIREVEGEPQMGVVFCEAPRLLRAA